jgi:predicted transcriptional regulator of viral defense system
MALADALGRLKAMGPSVLRTADIVAAFDIRKDHASHMLARLAESGHVARIKRGLWALTEGLDPLTLPPHLTAPFPSYVSLHTALYYHGMVSQIPDVVYCVSLARTRVYRTPVATVSVHHIAVPFFMGYDGTTRRGIRMATPEKALLDFLYLTPAKTRLFADLPEVSLPSQFSVRTSRRMIREIPSRRRRALVTQRFEDLLAQRE